MLFLFQNSTFFIRHAVHVRQKDTVITKYKINVINFFYIIKFVWSLIEFPSHICEKTFYPVFTNSSFSVRIWVFFFFTSSQKLDTFLSIYIIPRIIIIIIIYACIGCWSHFAYQNFYLIIYLIVKAFLCHILSIISREQLSEVFYSSAEFSFQNRIKLIDQHQWMDFPKEI